MGGAPASGESSRGGSPSPVKGQSSTQCGRRGRSSRRVRRASRAAEVTGRGEPVEQESVGEVESQCVCRSWRSERRSGRRGEAASRGESRRRGEEGQSEALGTTVDGTAVEFGGPGERP